MDTTLLSYTSETGNLKCVGFHHSISTLSSPSLTEATDIARSRLNGILKKKGPPKAKIEVAFKSVLMKTLFRFQFLSVTLETQQHHDSLFGSFVRKVLHCAPGFATDLIFINRQDAGLGLRSNQPSQTLHAH